MSDRFAIATNGAYPVLSPEDMVECDSKDSGCNGGNLALAWNYLKSTGIVTDTCLPYTSGDGTAARCPTKCSDSEAFTKHKVSAITKSTTIS